MNLETIKSIPANIDYTKVKGILIGFFVPIIASPLGMIWMPLWPIIAGILLYKKKYDILFGFGLFGGLLIILGILALAGGD